ncbi:MAG: hypothetical protein ACYCVN_02550, partial [Acidimicrobiales bacterium]
RQGEPDREVGMGRRHPRPPAHRRDGRLERPQELSKRLARWPGCTSRALRTDAYAVPKRPPSVPTSL